MKKNIVVLIALAIIPFVTMASNEGKCTKSTMSTENVKTADNEWTPIGTMEIAKRTGTKAFVTQKIQVYRNSNGDRAVKDKYGYHQIEENSQYGRFPSDECPECGYKYMVFYEGTYWYTNGIVKQTYGSY